MNAAPERWHIGVCFVRKWLWPRATWEYRREHAQERAALLWPNASQLAVINQATGERWQRNGRAGEWQRVEATPPPPKASAELGRMWWIDSE